MASINIFPPFTTPVFNFIASVIYSLESPFNGRSKTKLLDDLRPKSITQQPLGPTQQFLEISGIQA